MRESHEDAVGGHSQRAQSCLWLCNVSPSIVNVATAGFANGKVRSAVLFLQIQRGKRPMGGLWEPRAVKATRLLPSHRLGLPSAQSWPRCSPPEAAAASSLSVGVRAASGSPNTPGVLGRKPGLSSPGSSRIGARCWVGGVLGAQPWPETELVLCSHFTSLT